MPAAVLRAWEARYGLFAPRRTVGGYRLYGPEERRRARRMRSLLARGVAAAESAELVLGKPRGSAGDLADALEGFDPLAAQRALDALLAGPEPEAGVAGVLPLIAKLGPERRHVARRMLETRLLALGDRWHEGPGRLALVGCGPDEDDTLPAIVCALALRRRGWRIVYVGARTPVTAFASAAKTLEPAAIVTVGEVPGVGVTPIR